MDINAFSSWLKSVLPENYYQMYVLVSTNQWMQGLIVLLVFTIFALPFRMLLFAVLRSILKRSGYVGDPKYLASLERSMLYTIIGLGIIVSISAMTDWFRPLVYLRPVIFTFLCLSWMFVCLGIAKASIAFVASGAKEGSSINKRTEPIIHIGMNMLIIFFWAYVLLTVWGINPMGLVASAGVFGLALGFAAKDTLANLFAGFFIIADAPYQVGDYINLESGERGKVTQIGFRSTRLITRDDIEVTVPNGIIGNGKVINETRGGAGRVRVRISVQAAYSDPLDEVSDALLAAGLNHEEVCNQPKARVRVRAFADSGIDLQLLCWITNPENRGRITHELYTAVKKEFDKNGFEIPYPKQDIYIKKAIEPVVGHLPGQIKKKNGVDGIASSQFNGSNGAP